MVLTIVLSVLLSGSPSENEKPMETIRFTDMITEKEIEIPKATITYIKSR